MTSPKRTRRMGTHEDIERKLGPASTTSERIHGLIDCGIPGAVLAELTEAKPSTLRNWQSGAAEPRRPAAKRLDDIRYALSRLIQGGLEPERAGNWMLSRQPDPPHPRPIELIAREPETVFAMIQAAQPTLPLPPFPLHGAQ